MKLTITANISLIATYATVGGTLLATILTGNPAIVSAIIACAGYLTDKYSPYKKASVWASCNYSWKYKWKTMRKSFIVVSVRYRDYSFRNYKHGYVFG